MRQASSKESWQVAPRDLFLLSFVMQQRAIRLDQLPHFITLMDSSSDSRQKGTSKSALHQLVERLQRAGLLHLHRVEKGQPDWIWLTKEGARTLGSLSPWKRPARHTLPFLYATNAVRLLLTEHDLQTTWVSHQQLRCSETRKSSSHLPTAELLTEAGERIAIHVIFRLTGTEEQLAIRMLQQLERETSPGTPYYTALWYYASLEGAQRLRNARTRVAELTTKEQARAIALFSYPLTQQHLLSRGHGSPVRALTWSADGRHLTSVGEEVHVWDTTTGARQVRLSLAALPSLVGWSCDGGWMSVISQEGRLSFWEGATRSFLTPDYSERIVGLAWSPHQSDLVVLCSATGLLHLYDVRHQTLHWETHSRDGTASLTWSPDGQSLAVGGKNSTVSLFHAATGKPLQGFKKHQHACTTLTWSPDSQQLASADSGTILIWDATTGKKRRTIRSKTSEVHLLAWSPDGTRLACAGSDPCVQVWHLPTGRLLQSAQDHAETITSLAWSPDGTLLASASEDGTVQVSPTMGGL